MRRTSLIAILIYLASSCLPAQAQSLFDDLGNLAEPLGSDALLNWDVLSENQLHYVEFPSVPDFVIGPETTCESVPSRYAPIYRFTLKSRLDGATFPELYIFGLSPADMAIAVQTPSGALHCNDDHDDFSLLAPGVELKNAPYGLYQIWLLPVATPPAGAKMRVGISTDNFPWIPRGGSVALSDNVVREPQQFPLHAGGTYETASVVQNCPGFINLPRPDFSILALRGGDEIHIALEGDFPVVLIVENDLAGLYCFGSVPRGERQRASMVVRPSEKGVYRIWAGVLNREDIGGSIDLQIRQVASKSDADPDGATGLSDSSPSGLTTGLSIPVFHAKLTGALLSILLHESAHALVHILDPVVTGPEEDNADEFATMLILEYARLGNREAHAIVRAYAGVFQALWKSYKEELAGQERGIPERDFWDEHSFDVKRAANVLCLLYGAFPDRYDDIPEELSADERWRARCREDYERKRGVWQRVLLPYEAPSDDALDMLLPQVAPKDRPHFQLAFSPSERSPGRYYDGKMLSSTYETALALVSNRVILPFDVPVYARPCGSRDAYYDPDEKHILICHEVADWIADAYVRYETGLDFEDWWERERAGSVQADLVGLWRARAQSYWPDGGEIVTNLELSADGQFRYWQHEAADDQTDPSDRRPVFEEGLWGVSSSSFGGEVRGGIWYLEPAIGRVLWSLIENRSGDTLKLLYQLSGDYKRVR